MGDPADRGGDSAADLAAHVTELLTQILGVHSVDDVLRIVCEHTQRITRADGCLIEIAEGDEMVYRAASGFLVPFVGTRLPRSQSLSGLAMETAAIQTSKDSTHDPRVNVLMNRKLGARSMVVIPLKHGDSIIGVLKPVWRKPEAFGEDVVRTLGLLAGIVAIAIRHAEESQDRNEMQRALEASEARWRDVVEQSLAGIYVIRNERFVYANDRYLDILGYTLDELLALPAALDVVVPEDRELTFSRFRERLDDDVERRGRIARCLRRDGSVVELQVFGSVVESPEGMYFMGTVIDVTERNQADQWLRASEEWFRNLIEGASDMIGVTELDGVLTYVSPSVREQLGYAPEQLVNLNAFDFIHEEDRDRVRRDIQAIVANPSHRVETRMRFRHATLGWRDCETRLRLVQAEGRPVVIVNSRDVTVQTALQRQVADAERLSSLGRVASSLAHEFNNVLMGIQPFADLIARTRDEGKLEKAAIGIQNAVRRGRTITQQVVRFTRGEQPRCRNVSVDGVLKMVRESLTEQLPADVHLEMRSTPELRAMVDAEQVSQLLVNLGLNGRDAMTGGGSLTISAHEAEGTTFPFGVLPADVAGGFVHFTVTDSGSGIEPEILSRIFEPLFTTRKAKGGSGLGLSIAQQIATAHHGALFVESRVGEGTSFHAFLPAASQPANSISEAPAVAYPTGLKRVLIVDDDDLVADAVMMALGTMQILTHRVATGAAAVAATELFKPGLVLLDYGLPDMTGAAVYGLLRARWSDLPIVFATGHADAARLREEVGNPRLEVCLKPFEISRLMSAMNTAMSSDAS
jgi:PAS domain S-box-containing protein